MGKAPKSLNGMGTSINRYPVVIDGYIWYSTAGVRMVTDTIIFCNYYRTIQAGGLIGLPLGRDLLLSSQIQIGNRPGYWSSHKEQEDIQRLLGFVKNW